MANIIENRLTLRGTPEDIAEVLDSISTPCGESDGKDRLYIDFNKIAPMPKTLDIPCSALVEDMHKYVDGAAKSKRLENVKENSADWNELLDNARKRKFNLEHYGYPDWYEWRLHNWGVKWNAYDQDMEGNTISFHTPWSGVPELIGRLAEKFPKVKFEYMCWDLDWGETEEDALICVFNDK